MTDQPVDDLPTLEDVLLNVRTTLRLLEAVTQWHRCAVRFCDELATPHPDALAALEAVIGRDAAALDVLMKSWPGQIANWRPGDPVPPAAGEVGRNAAQPRRDRQPGEPD